MDKNFRIRLGLSFLVVSLLGFGVLLRGAYLMLVPSERLSSMMNRQFRQDPPQLPRRGYIVDKNMEPIAVSMEVRSLFVNPNKVQKKNQVAGWLAKALNLPVSTVRAKLRADKGFIWIKRQLNETEQEAVEALLDKHPLLNLSVGLAKESKRFYPNQSLAAQLLGFTGMDSNGLEGLELYYEKDLAGAFSKGKNADGHTLVLTVDKALQYTVEEELERGVKAAGAKAATAIVMNSETGDVVAMASYPTFNANRYSSSVADHRRNRAITDSYELGSIMKPIVVAGALEQNIINPGTKVFCEHGKMQIGKHWVKEAEAKDKWGWLTVGEMLQKSSNVGASKVGFLYGSANTYNWYKKMGLTRKSEIDLPGEVAGYIPPHEKWSKILLSNISFGQGLSVTPMQMVRAYAAFANGGHLVSPRLVQKVYSFEGEFIREFPLKPKVRVMSEKTAAAVTKMLLGVATEDGTAPKAAIPGFAVVGKTGTAQKAIAGHGYKSGKYIASFLGFAEGVKPNHVVLVTVDEPSFPYFGGEAAAPIFKKILTAVLAREGIAPNREMAPEIRLTKTKEEKIIERFSEIAAAPAPVPAEFLSRQSDQWLMPNFAGRTGREVLDLMNGKEVLVRMKGGGRVVEQSPSAGSVLKKGDILWVRLERSVD